MARPAESRMRVEREYGKSIKEVMQELYIDKNLHSSDIAKILKVTHGTIVRWCRQSGLPVKPKGGRIKFPETLWPKMAELYERGMSTYEIAKIYNCSNCTVFDCLNKYGVKLRSVNEARKRQYSLNENYFEKIDTSNKAYFLGWAASDGCVTKNKNGYTFKLKLHEKDLAIIEKLKEEIGSDQAISSEIMGSGNTAAFITLHSAKLINDLISHGVVPNKSKTMSAPIGLPYELEGHFIRGYFDGNGCVTRSHKGTNFLKIEFSGATPIIEWIAESIKSHTGLPKNKVCKIKPYFSTLSYSCSKVKIIRDFMYPTGGEFGLKRKKDILFGI